MDGGREVSYESMYIEGPVSEGAFLEKSVRTPNHITNMFRN